MTDGSAVREMEGKIGEVSGAVDRLLGEMGRVIVGQKHLTRRLVMALLADGHVLLEGLPGLAKTTAIKTLAQATDLRFSRVQFTPDLLPADVIGTQIYDPRSGEFRVKKGPIFANLVLADEINRAPAKVQSALLEAMQERQVTIGDQTFKIDQPFLVMATQNPIEQEGTYPLPEAQVDRFLFKVRVDYGSMDDEAEIIARVADRDPVQLQPALHASDLIRLRSMVRHIHVAEKIRRYIVQLVFATRTPKEFGLKELAPFIQFGASPRASICLDIAAKVSAMMEGRAFVTPQDVKDVGADVLRHRIIPSYEAEAENISSEQIVKKIFDRIDVP